MALFDFFPRSASIISIEDTQLIKITASDLFKIYHQDLEQFTLLQMNLGREVTRRLRNADEQLFEERMQANIDGDQVSFHPDLKTVEMQQPVNTPSSFHYDAVLAHQEPPANTRAFQYQRLTLEYPPVR